jgi:hypothetical protein
MSTAKQRIANLENARLSTGPRSEAGKQRSSLNALKTGLTGRTVLLPGEDVAAYRQHAERIFAIYNPATDEETALVQVLVDTRWRLERCAMLEHNLFALGVIEFAALYEAEPEENRMALIQAHTFRSYTKDFKNLNTQEARLQRIYERTCTELYAIQAARFEAEEQPALEELKAAASPHNALGAAQRFDPAQNGFEFSTEQLTQLLASSGACHSPAAFSAIPPDCR